MFEIPLFAILAISGQIRENSLIWSSLIWSHHCTSITVRFKNFRVENFRYLLKTFEIFEIHDLYQGVKTFEVFDILRNFQVINQFQARKLGKHSHLPILDSILKGDF